MQKAKAKHASFDQSFDDTLLNQYSLLCPDFREVVNVPGTNEKFQLSTYKQAIGKEFKRLTFYLIPVDDFTDMSDESDSEATAKPAKELSLCEFFSGACRKREAKRDVTGSSDDGNDDKEIREMDRCPWDASEQLVPQIKELVGNTYFLIFDMRLAEGTRIYLTCLGQLGTSKRISQPSKLIFFHSGGHLAATDFGKVAPKKCQNIIICRFIRQKV